MDIVKLVEDGFSAREIAEVTGFHLVKIHRMLRELGLTARRTKQRFLIPDEQLVIAVSEARNHRDVLRRLKLAVSGSSNRILKARIAALGLDTSHFDTHADRGRRSLASLHSRLRLSNEEVLVAGRERSHRVLRRVLVAVHGRPQCVVCGNPGEWMGQPLTLHIDHINGDHSDNRVTNLRWLCPNCHTQTPTYGTRTRNPPHKDDLLPHSEDCPKALKVHPVHQTKIEWPPPEQLFAMITHSSYLAVGRQLGVSGNAVRKRLRNHPPTQEGLVTQ